MIDRNDLNFDDKKTKIFARLRNYTGSAFILLFGRSAQRAFRSRFGSGALDESAE